MEKKNVYTQKMFYEEVIEAMADNENAVAMARKKLEQLETKNSKVDGKKSTEQREICDQIIAVLCENDKMKNGEITLAVNAKFGTEYTPNKILAMIKKMLPADEKNPNGSGEVVRIAEKKEVFFALAQE